jgi:glucokinase
MVHRVERPTSDGLSTWPNAGVTLARMIRRLCEECRIHTSELESIGVSCGGPLRSAEGTILSPPNLPGWKDVPIKAFLADQFGVSRIYVDNDANATAVAELRWGAGKGTNSLAYLTCGTGIGAGIILDGRIYRGKNDLAGEIGHAVVIPDGPLCVCGKRGCLESLASGSSIGRMGAAAYGKSEMTGKAVIELAHTGDPAAVEIVLSAAYYLGIGISNLLHTLDIELIILGSLAVYAGERYMDKVQSTVVENTWKSILENTRIVPSGLGYRTQDLAALAMALPMED